MPDVYPIRIYVLKRNPSNPESSEMMPSEGIPAYRDIKRIYQIGAHAFRDVSELYYELLEKGSAIYGPAFTIEKKKGDDKVRALVYVTTEYDIRAFVEPVPLEEFTKKEDYEFFRVSYISDRLVKITGALYPYYLVEPGEMFYIPYTYSFAIALRKIRFRGLLLRLGKIEEFDKYRPLLEGINEGVDKLIIKPVEE